MSAHTAEDLEQQAQQALNRAAEARAAAVRARQEEQQRVELAQREFDEQLVASFSRARLDAAVDQARERLDEHLAADPTVAAFANLLHAEYTRRDGVVELVAALSRLGRPTDGAALPQPPRVDPTATLGAAVERIAADRAAADRDALATQRENAATATTTEETT